MSSRLISEILRRMKLLGLNMKQLSEKAGLKETYVKDIVSGKSKNPTTSKLAKLARALGCSVGDLTGERAVRLENPDLVSISELDVYAAAGPGGDGERGNAIMENEEADMIVGTHTMPAASFREAYGVPPARIRIIPVKGNSMVPDLWPGQRVMVDVEDKAPSPPGIFVIWDGMALVLKYVEVIANSDPLRVRITSRNPAFLPYERMLDEAYINGRVVGVWARI